MKKNIKKQNGIAAADGIVAVLIISLFIGLIATISYNTYLASTSIKRNSEATRISS